MQLIILIICFLIQHPRLMTTQQSPPTPTQSTPDLSVIISRHALDFLLGQTQEILNRQLAVLKLPSASQDIDGGRVEIHGVSLTKFVQPTYFYDLESPNTLVWGLQDASLYVNGQWSGQKKIILPSVKGSGGFEADLENLSLLLRARLGLDQKTWLTKIDQFQCNATIQNLTTKATGGVMGYVLSIFRGTVSEKVKPLLEEAICTQMEKLIEQDVDRDLLQKLPTKYDVGRKFVFNVQMTQAPKVDSQLGYVQLDHRVSVVYDGKDETAKYLQSAIQQNGQSSPAPLKAPLDRMIYIRVSEKPANTLLFSMHIENMTAFVIDEHISQQTSDYLRLQCQPQENCLGQSLQGISSLYPPPAKGAMRIYTSRQPQIRFLDGNADLQIPLVMEITVRTGPPQYAEDSLLVADIDMQATLHLAVDKDGKKILGDWQLYKFDCVARPSGVGSLVKVDNQKLGDSLKGFVVDQGNLKLTNGIDVPVASTFVPGYGLKNVQLKLLSKVMQFEADMVVQPGFKTN